MGRRVCKRWRASRTCRCSLQLWRPTASLTPLSPTRRMAPRALAVFGTCRGSGRSAVSTASAAVPHGPSPLVSHGSRANTRELQPRNVTASYLDDVILGPSPLGSHGTLPCLMPVTSSSSPSNVICRPDMGVPPFVKQHACLGADRHGYPCHTRPQRAAPMTSPTECSAASVDSCLYCSR